MSRTYMRNRRALGPNHLVVLEDAPLTAPYQVPEVGPKRKDPDPDIVVTIGGAVIFTCKLSLARKFHRLEFGKTRRGWVVWGLDLSLPLIQELYREVPNRAKVR